MTDGRSRVDPVTKHLRAVAGARALHGRGLTSTEAARAAFLEKLKNEADPDGKLRSGNRKARNLFKRRFDDLKAAHQLRMTLAARAARKAKKEAAGASTTSD